MNPVSNAKVKQMVYSGTSGLVLPVSNKRLFPEAFQDKSRLHYYASLFNSVEINSSFKKLPMARTVEKWAASVPEGFQFTFKLSSVVTHNKGLEFEPGDIYTFLQVVNQVEEKKGCLLVQFPGKLSVAESSQFIKLLSIMREADPQEAWKVAVEFRHLSWYNKEIYQILDNYHVGLVSHDMHNLGPPVIITTGGFAYIRLHGTEKSYRGSYAEDILAGYAHQIKSWNAEGKQVYIYFNNTLGDAANNLLTLNRLLEK